MLRLKAHHAATAAQGAAQPPTLDVALPLYENFAGSGDHPSRPTDLPRRVPPDVTAVEIGRHPDRSREPLHIGSELFLPVPLTDVALSHLRIELNSERSLWIVRPIDPVLYMEGFAGQWRLLEGSLALVGLHALTLGFDYRHSPIVTLVVNGPSFHSRRHLGQDLTW